jgi:tetratricopeptide (TPR) repeat protein
MSWQPGDRLERAVAAYLDHQGVSSQSDDDFLVRHGELRDLLEPMLTTGQGPAAPPPRRLGDFELLRELGRGGMGVVWEARQHSLDRRVAVKVLAPGLTESPNAVARLRREAATAARLSHQNLVKVLGVGSEAGVHFLAMELVDGEPIDRTRRSPHQLAELLAQVGDALDHAHRAGVVHRDVKPANILVRDDGTATLMDFGLARTDDQPGLTRSGAFAGTPHYAAPEQLRGEAVDARSDVFALGVTLFELLTGHVPFSGPTAAAVLETMQRGAADARRSRPDVPRELSAIASRAIELRPGDRYATAAAMARDLRAFRDGGVVSARPSSAARRVVKWARREPWRAVAVLMFAAGAPLLGVLGGQWLANRPLVRAAEATARAERAEQALAEAYFAITLADRPQALAALDAALAIEPDMAEALAVRALLVAPAEDNAGDASPLAGGPPLLAAVRHLLAAPGRSLRRTVDDWGDPAAARKAVSGISLAARMAPAPRLPLYVLLGSVAGSAGARSHAADAAAVLGQRWPDLPAAQRARARALRIVDPKEAVALLRRCVAARPDDVALRFELVALLCGQGDKEAALAESRAVPVLAPNDAMAHVCFAEHLLKAGHALEAVPVYRRALELDSYNASTHYNLGVALDESEQREEALACYQRATGLNPDHAQAWNNIGLFYLDHGRIEEARAAVAQALRADPDLVQAHGNACELAVKANEPGAHWAELSRWSGRRPNDAGAHREIAAFLLSGEAASSFGTPADALRAALRALALSGFTDTEAAALAAAAWRRLGDPFAADLMASMCPAPARTEQPK